MDGMVAPEGWERVQSKAFGTHVGPFFRPREGGLACGFRTDGRHGNKRGVTHGGMVATAFDVAMGNACWDACGQKPCATVQLTVQYVGALPLEVFAVVRPEVMRVTRSLVFVRATLEAGEHLVATADGVWKILAWRGAPTA